jgi:hypothetical protein
MLFSNSPQGDLISAAGVRLRGAGGEPPRLRLWGLTVPLVPQEVEHLPLQSTLG